MELEYLAHDEDAEPIALPFQLLEKITDYFSHELIIGRGGFAVVYKAVLDNGIVAVKKLSNTHMYEEQFQGEVQCLMKVKHKNIVRFLGYCADTQGNISDYKGKMVMADVQQRLLCFEYLPKGSLDGYITDSPGELNWRKRYDMIKGICEGLHYLHQNNILHLDLTPGNILLDEDMMPKITDFGLSRCFEEDQTGVITKNVAGTRGYLAPECYNKEIILTHKFDLYSLGVIMIEILTGKKGCQVTIENWDQIRVCAKIGMECTEVDPAKRPASGTRELLLVHPSVICFPFEPNKAITCPLQLTNNTDKHVAFRLMDNSMESSFLRLPLYDVVPPNTPYTLIVTTQKKEDLPRKYIIDVILQSATLILGDDDHINTFRSQPDKFFQETGNDVQVVKQKALYTLTHIATSFSKVHVYIEMHLSCLDTNRAKQCELTFPGTAVTCIRFIERKQWIVAGTEDGYLHVYSYETRFQKITSLRVGAIENLESRAAHTHLAIHPTQPYLLSVYGFKVKLWDWDVGWECIQTFENEELMTILRVAFNPNDTFATASMDCTVEVWSLDSPEFIYTLVGHSSIVNCLDFFTCDDQEYLVTGSHDQTAKIWDLQKMMCIHTLEAFVSPVMSLLYQPDLQILITVIHGFQLYLLTNKIPIGIIHVPRRLIESSRLLIGKENAVAIIDVDDVNYQEQPTDKSEQQLSACTTHHAGDMSKCYNQEATNPQYKVEPKEKAWSKSKLLDVHPLELRFPYCPNEPIPCSLHLTNNTDENVAFRLVDKSGKSPWCFTKLPLCGIVPHGSTYTLTVTMKEEMKLKEETDFDLVIQSSLLGDKYIEVFNDQSESDTFFKEAKLFGNMVHEVTLKAVYVQYGEITSEFLINSFKVSDQDAGLVLLNWDLSWKTTRIFESEAVTAETVVFNTRDTNSFASGSYDGEVQVWRLDSSDPEYSLIGHLKKVTCLDFVTCGDQQYLISGSYDSTVKIWDLQKRECICTLEAMSPVHCVLAHPNLPVIITGTEHGIIHLWNSTDFRLKRTISLGGGGPVITLGCLMGSPRVVIGQENAFFAMDIHDDWGGQPQGRDNFIGKFQ
uniref:non-specific serine/threonine protein kinase n=1 Tax=Aegilops tauschii TaxID=37682 RepID=M8CDM9_AEGTA